MTGTDCDMQPQRKHTANNLQLTLLFKDIHIMIKAYVNSLKMSILIIFE